MAESKLNFNVPLLSTRRIQKTGVSVRRNKTKTNDSSSTVPFTWEQAPGRLKSKEKDSSVSSLSTTQEVFTPCLPPGKAITRFENSKIEETEDEFTDALDTLSLNDSFSINNSVSGVSGYDVVEMKKKPVKLSKDDDFMLNRFLPAAKAMTVEHQPHYASNRKPSSFMSEPTIQIRDLVPVENRQTHNKYVESIVMDDGEESEEDDQEEDVEVSEFAYLSKRGCGMLPQLCFKDSLGMLNIVKHNSSVTFPSHDQVKSSKVAQLKSRLQSVKKLALDSVSKQKLSGKVQSSVHEKVGKKFNSESNLIVASKSLSPYRHSRCISPFRTTSNSCPLHRDTRKETENLRANRLNKHIRNISWSHQDLHYPRSNGSTSSLLEKTVHVDTENSHMTNDQHNSNVMISPEELDANLEAFESISIGSVKMVNTSPDRSPLAPPSPKKPSESWLLHNLPSVTASQVPSRRFYPRKQERKEISRSVTNWETIVKTSYMHRDHIRYSKELVAHTSHQ